jgi:hypothetical protein
VTGYEDTARHEAAHVVVAGALGASDLSAVVYDRWDALAVLRDAQGLPLMPACRPAGRPGRRGRRRPAPAWGGVYCPGGGDGDD